MRRAVVALVGSLGARWLYRLLARGSLTIDTGIGRRLRQLGPVRFTIAAPREVVFELIATPYLGRTPRALQDELEVWERGSDMVLAAHFTRVKCGITTTVETVRFHRPDRIDFRVVRGPVPYLVESFLFDPADAGTQAPGGASSGPTSGQSAAGGANASRVSGSERFGGR